MHFYTPEVSLKEDVTYAGSIQIPNDMEDVLKRVHGDDVAETIAVVDIKSREMLQGGTHAIILIMLRSGRNYSFAL